MSNDPRTQEKLSPVKQALTEIRRLKRRLAAAEGGPMQPIAVVGMGLRLPGVSARADDLHASLAAGVDAIGEIPADRWDVDAFYDPEEAAPGRMYTREGGFLGDVRGFDPEFFGIAPFEAASIDPQHRLLLEVAWEALEHAGIRPTGLRGSSTGVFLGMSAADYNRLALADAESVDAYASVGTALSVAAGRIAYLLDLRGPAMTIDTACSSSLVAANMAARSLANGESNLAVVGGINLILSPEVTINFCQAGMLARDGRCKTFDEGADGYVRSEGCVVVILKRLADAQRDGDRVLGLIRGGAVNQDGRSSGITAPNGPAQEAVIRAALANAGVEADQIGYVEAHGTGTALGDPIELQALGAVFGKRPPEKPLWVGSAKTNFGHLEAAAGLVGLVKVVETLRNRQIPPHLHFRTPNAHVPWADLPISVPTRPIELDPHDGSRLAGVSSFGFSGTNAHLILEEAPAPVEAVAGEFPEPAFQVLPLSADRPEALRALAERYVDLLGTSSDALADIGYTAGVGRAHLSHRLAVVAADKAAARVALERWLAGDEHDGVISGPSEGVAETGLTFVFDEPTPEEAAAALRLRDAAPAPRRVLEACDEILGAGASIGTTGAQSEAESARLRSFAGQLAVHHLLQSWGLDPDVVIGGGSGTMAAACVAGAMTLDAAVQAIHAADAGGDANTDAGGDANTDGNAGADADTVESIARRAAAQAPDRELFLADDGGSPRPVAAGDSTSTWSTAPPAPLALDAAVDLSVEQEALRVVVIGSASGRLVPQSDDECSVDPVAVDSRHHRDDAQAAALAVLARLYAAGAEIDWAAVHAGHHRRRVSLPTYPFQRRPFWLPERPQVGAALRAGAGSANASIAEPTTPFDAALVAATARASLAPLDMNIDSYAEKWSRLGELSRTLGHNRLVGLGAFVDSEPFDLDTALSRTGIKPIYGLIVRRWLDAMVDAGTLERVTDAWRAAAPPTRLDEAPAWEAVEAAMQDNQPLLAYIRNCVTHLEGVLTGSVSPLETLFPDGSFDLAVDLYERATQLRYINGIAAAVVGAWVDEQMPSGGIRVLEIGAGTGGTTSSLLPVLPAERTRYDYSDVSDIFLDFSRERFPDTSFLRARRFDMEQEIEEQGLEPGSYDIVTASNVVHAARDLRAALRRVRSLLAPGGLLLMIESTGHLEFHDITTGLIEGWQHFEDDVRSETPLLDVDQWRRVLEEEGFGAVGASPPADSPAAVLAQHVVFAVAPGEHEARRDAELDPLESVQPAAPAEAAAPVGAARPDASVRGPAAGAPAGADAFVARVQAAVVSEREQVATNAVRACVVDVLRADPSRPPSVDARLMELGLDSLMAVRLRNAIQKQLGLPFSLPSTLMFDYPTVRHIARLILERLDDAEPAGETAPDSGDDTSAADARRGADAGSSSEEDREAEIAGLSDDEVEAMLVDRLNAGDTR